MGGPSILKPAAPVIPVARHPPPRPAPALPPRRLGGDGQPHSHQKPTTVPNDKDKKFESSTKYRTDTPASGSNDPTPKAKPAQPSQPTLPLAEPDGEPDDSEELRPDRNNDPPSEAESDETRYYFQMKSISCLMRRTGSTTLRTKNCVQTQHPPRCRDIWMEHLWIPKR